MTSVLTVTRFAPSPTGYLHLGHVRSALEGWRASRRDRGRFLLRLEDIDQTRCRDEYAAALLEDLAWLGLTWDGPVRKQSEHFDDYRRALDRLDAMAVLYPCFCTRREIRDEIARAGGAPHGQSGSPYPGTCRDLSPRSRDEKRRAGFDYGLRLDLARALALTGPLDWVEEGESGAHRKRVDPAPLGDVVIARKEMPASYHLAVTVDDAIQGVTLVTRGEDLMAATDVHRVLQALLGLPTPHYRHHELLTDAAGRRLAKRDHALTIRSMRESGVSPTEIIAQVAPTERGSGRRSRRG
ncbi:MAG TPA: tRNA glutamyl-Q(34) synthetase GluQRS [Stellaceae bacterium]|nr:tRNA glutamyl-Q(34) synthetase GluQRS [Stellaceae bacterium]